MGMTSTIPETASGRSSSGSPRGGKSKAATRSKEQREALRRSSRPRVVRTARRTIPSVAVTAAIWSLVTGLMLCSGVTVLAWVVSGHGTDPLDGAMRTGALAFVAAHHAPISMASGIFSLIPLGLLFVPLALLFRGGRWAARASRTTTLPDAILLTVVAATTYAAMVTLVSTVAVVAGAQVMAVPAFIAAELVALIGVGLGVLSGSGLGSEVSSRSPDRLRVAALGAATMLAALGAVTGAVALIAVATHIGAITNLGEELAPGTADGAVLCLLGLLYVPTLIVWALSYLSGIGFLLGGALISPFQHGGGLIPAFPLLAATPTDPPSHAIALLVLPVLAGVIGGGLLARRTKRLGVSASLVDTLLAVLLTGVAVTGLMLLSAGSMGNGRLAMVGPIVWQAGLAITGLVGVGAFPTTMLAGRMWRSVDLRTVRLARKDATGKTAKAATPEVRDHPYRGISNRLSSVWNRIKPLLHSTGE